MTVYMMEFNNPAGMMVDAIHGSDTIPALHVSKPRNGFPVDAAALTENLVHLLNGAPAPHRLNSGGLQIHYHRHAAGLTLQHRKAGEDGGVSAEGLHLTMMDSLPGAVRDDLAAKMTPALMQSLCSGIDMKAPSAQGAAVTAKKQDFRL